MSATDNSPAVPPSSAEALPVEVARDLWLQLHKTRSNALARPKALEPAEEELYQNLTARFVRVSAR